MKKSLLLLSFFLIGGCLIADSVNAATLTTAKDTISTSRPSAVASLNVGTTAPASQVVIDEVTGSLSRYIASDSARLVGAPGASEVVTVASMSAISGSTAALYFNTKTVGNHDTGSTVMVPVTAQHVVAFRTVNSVPASGTIQVIFPVGNTTTPSYSSPIGFSFNGLASADLSATFSPAGPTCATWTITNTSGLVQCNIGTGITGPTNVTLNIGLTSTNPVLINPSKTATTGTSNNWTVQFKTRDNTGVEIDTAKVRIATIESVEVYATVDPYLTFSIAGVANAVAANTDNTGCGASEPTNSGTNSTATEVNLGVLGGVVNLAAQLMTITTNGINGYSLTATSSGHLIDPALGYFLADAQGTPTANDLPIPAVMAAGTTAYGIHPCGQDVTIATWGPNICTAGIYCKFANPATTYYYTLASDGSGPIGSGSVDGTGDGLTTVEYAATISGIVPAGLYRTVMTYVATATF